jgi:alpha-mannosidase
MLSTELTDTQSDTANEAAQFSIFLVHHTHWDREWWATFQDFRILLVETIDELFEALDEDPEFRTFLLDSQMIVLRDYLEIRPEKRETLAAYLRAGRIQSGPWYVMPDEFLVSGEAHIRNLLLGRRIAREMDCPVLDIGYLPDMFGHIAQMPQILRGFGIDNAFVWRGYGGEPETVKQEFLWQSPDGSEVLTHWFPDGYYRMPFLHFGNPDRPHEDKLGRILYAIEQWGPRATAGVLLLPYGGDHRPIDRGLPAKIAEANDAIKGLGEIRWGTTQEYLDAVRERNPRLSTVTGELRTGGPDHPHVLAGTWATRLYLKQLNFRGQIWLERFAEPLSALAWQLGRRYDSALLWKAWELLLQNHPHDSICGCSIDQVHREMISRFDQSSQIARIMAEKAAHHINARIDTMPPQSHGGALDECERALVVHNSLPHTRSGWASVWIERGEINLRAYRLLDVEGNEVPFQVRQVEGVVPMTDRAQHTEIGFVAEYVPAMGYRAYTLVRREKPLSPRQFLFTAVQPSALSRGDEVVTDLAVGNNTLENRWLRVQADPTSGTVSITDLTTGQVYPGLNEFEDGGDAGDAYTYSPPLNDTVLRTSTRARVHVSVAEAGYARATLQIDLDWELPAELTADRFSRSSSYVETRISTYISMVAGSRCLEITTEWENLSRDHRLRALFPLGAAAEYSHAQGQFDVTRRPVETQQCGNGWQELPLPTLPQQGWVAVESGERGLLIANRGLPEFEPLADAGGTVALTILRAVGWLSRDDTLVRSDGAGAPTSTPDAQMTGPNRVSYAVIPYSNSWLTSAAYRVADEYLAPLYGSSTGIHPGDRPPAGGLFELSGDHTLILSACKQSEQGEDLILRWWNVAAAPTRAWLRLGQRPLAVHRVDLKEEVQADSALPVEADGSVIVEAAAAEIVTVAVTFPPVRPLKRGEALR